jgi:hypothetical protein
MLRVHGLVRDQNIPAAGAGPFGEYTLSLGERCAPLEGLV